MTALTEALVAAQAEMPHLTRDATAEVQTKTGGKYSYAYMTLEKLLAETVPVLNKHGLALVQYPCVEDGRHALKTEIRHVSGDAVWTIVYLPVELDAPAQIVGSALTYFRRYSLTAMLGLSADEDDDGKQAEPAKAEAKPSAAKKNISPGMGKQIGLNIKLLQGAFPEHPGEGRTWVDVAKAWTRDRFDKESVLDLTEAEGVALNDWLEDKYREAQRDEQIPFDGGPEADAESV